jgi:hypothetical protein
VSKQCQHPGEDTYIHGLEQNPTSRNEKQNKNTTKYSKTTKPVGKLYPAIRCNNPESKTG